MADEQVDRNVVERSFFAPQRKNIKTTTQSRHMFSRNFVERRDLEQYFWTTSTVDALCRALTFEPELCCLSTPSIAQAFWIQEDRAVTLLDIDTRFDYLPGFRFWDLRHIPSLPMGEAETFRVLVFDPPFFYIPMADLYRAVLEVCKGDTSTGLMIGFLVRKEANLFAHFREFRLSKTKFVLEYANVKPNKWRNYALYSNVDLPGIKRIRKPR
ncbi:hypothetical protein MPTK1_3g21710 [Marchantia polymorpha subsp. ruderalis]|uniref:N6-adenine methyltransferase n=2 Tax=Marchantia polymorpha TaxID=3197 RepID=A0AAF6B3B8_MARPO|nr:hypothetical protein MARPO_0089s0045 [Marchantia polymorpha]BBN06502.1 hypothetical protein Mp_3g21710 [Marchantia polymorpha subsp. ruderalis]|eukprot:PTQ33417.1 hypothetical protein MARPO_0089s0045 [Marchantia polymorpha]